MVFLIEPAGRPCATGASGRRRIGGKQALLLGNNPVPLSKGAAMTSLVTRRMDTIKEMTYT